jgi:hypothetical protein
VEKAEAKRENEREASRSSGGDLIPAGMVVVNNHQQKAREPPPNKAAGRAYLDELKQTMGIRPGGSEL